MASHFLWPKGNFHKSIIYPPYAVPITIVEDTLQLMFPSGYPVLCSSGRAALNISLLCSQAERKDLVDVFPYASHCVLDAVSRVATPTSGSQNSRLKILYHQWGFVQKHRTHSIVIEDSVDTLCLPGTKLFPAGGAFEIWSLPKILGTSSGGVLWCRDRNVAKQARHIRDNRGGGLMQWSLRILSKTIPAMHFYWQGLEASKGAVSTFQAAEILKAIQKWDCIVSNRLKKLNILWPYAVNWLRKPRNRLPSVIPIKSDKSEFFLKELGLISGYRMFTRTVLPGVHTYEKVLPIPIHQDVDEVWLDDLVIKLKLRVLPDE